MKALTGRMTARVKGILKNLLVVVKLYLQLSSFSYVEINKTNLHLVSYPGGQIGHCTIKSVPKKYAHNHHKLQPFGNFAMCTPVLQSETITNIYKQVFFSLHRQISIVDVLYSGEYDIMMLL